MTKNILIGIASIAIIATTILFIGKEDPKPHTVTNYAPVVVSLGEVDTDLLLDLINEKRQDHGVQPLTRNRKLISAACSKAIDMVKNDYWAHVAPSGLEPSDFILATDYDYSAAGENLAMSKHSDEQAIFSSWVNSDGHLKNILNEGYTQAGICTKVAPDYLSDGQTIIIVNLFATPR